MSGKITDRIRLIASDVDGTLVKDGTSYLNPEYYEVIRKLAEKEVLFVASSGRAYQSIERLFAPVIHQIGAISESGTMVWKRGVGSVLAPIPYEYISEMTEDIKNVDGVGIMVSTQDKLYLLEKDDRLSTWLKEGYQYDLIPCPETGFPQDEVYVKLAIHYPEEVERVTKDFVEKWKNKMHLCYAGNMWLDCLMPGVNKGSALSVIQRDLGISPEETMVFGDNQNDIEMMRDAKYSYAVETARDDVKAEAFEIIPSYSEDGVLQQMKKLLSQLS